MEDGCGSPWSSPSADESEGSDEEEVEDEAWAEAVQVPDDVGGANLWADQGREGAAAVRLQPA